MCKLHSLVVITRGYYGMPEFGKVPRYFIFAVINAWPLKHVNELSEVYAQAWMPSPACCAKG